MLITRIKMKKPKKKLKLYVWTNVLRDYTPGIMFALATFIEHAKKLIQDRFPYIDPREFEVEPPQTYTKPHGFALWGGG